LPELLATQAAAPTPVHIPEGEKDADTLAALGPAQQSRRLFLQFRMTPGTCSERLPAMQALSAQL
jgi:hypothetical protein